MFDEGGDEMGTGESHAETGFPRFEHSQWTVEGEIERFGAFGRAGARARGWKRVVAVGLALGIIVPLVVGLVAAMAQALG